MLPFVIFLSVCGSSGCRLSHAHARLSFGFSLFACLIWGRKLLKGEGEFPNNSLELSNISFLSFSFLFFYLLCFTIIWYSITITLLYNANIMLKNTLFSAET